ncbi:MAG: ThuA domain-containing protein, partial [Alcaligenaceae bacterium]
MKFQLSASGGAIAATLLAISLSGCGGGDDDAPFVAEADASFDTYYNVCRGTDPKCYNEWGAFASTPNRVLIYSRTAGPRHGNLGTAMGPGLNPVMNADNIMQA